MQLNHNVYSVIALLLTLCLATNVFAKAPLWGVDVSAPISSSKSQSHRIIARLKPAKTGRPFSQVPLNTPGLTKIKEIHFPFSKQKRFTARKIKQKIRNPLTVFEINDGRSMEQAIDDLIESGQVEYAEADSIVHLDNTTPNDPSFNQLWGLNNTGQTGGIADADIDAIEAWDITTGTSNVIVAVIDTGVDYTHPDLAANMWVNPNEIPDNGIDDDGNGYIDDIHGIDLANDDSDPMDDNSHGTHVSGTIGGVGNDNQGISGVNWNVKIMALKFLSASGSGFSSDAITALNYIIDLKINHGINVAITNNSWGGGTYNQGLYNAIEAARDAGILFVAAAGNDAEDTDANAHYPASYQLENIISVAATDDTDTLSYFTNYGVNSVHIAAPGSDVYSTINNGGYSTYSGTSMAAPHVAGTAALVLANDPTRSWVEIKDLLMETVDPLINLDTTVISGGRLNAFNALSCDILTVPASLNVLTPRNGHGVIINTDTTLSLKARKCGYPVTGLSVDVTPGDGTNPGLSDDGIAPDVTANDGIYTGSWTATTKGLTSLSYHVVAAGFDETTNISVNVVENYINSTIPIDWLDITTATALFPETFNEVNLVPLGFDFTYYGINYNEVHINSDGYLSFGSGIINHENVAIPNVGAPNNFIAPYWDYLRRTSATYYKTEGNAPNRRFIITWDKIRVIYAYETITFQAILYEGSNDIVFQYLDTDTGNTDYDQGHSATVGIEYYDGTTGVPYSFNTANSIPDNFALLFSNEVCDPNTSPSYMSIKSPVSNTPILPGSDVELRVNMTQCHLPLSGVTITVDTSDGSTITLLDDGTAPDLVAGDGTYTANWQPVSPGSPTLEFHATGQGINESHFHPITVVALPTYSIASIPIDWVDATTGTGILDDGYITTERVSIGFDFSFYGLPYNEINIGTNGMLNFGLGHASALNLSIPNNQLPNNYIAPYWDFLYPSNGDKIYYLLEGDIPHRRFIVQWNAIPNYLASDSFTFQAILYEGSNEIRYQYLDTFANDSTLDHGKSATVGIENFDGSDGLLYSYNTANSIPDNSALSITNTSCDPATEAPYFVIEDPSETVNIFENDTFTLKLHALLCNAPNTGLSVNVAISNGSQVTLLDDGVNPDLIAGDGAYTANWQAITTGSTSFDFHVSGNNIDQTLTTTKNIIENYSITPVPIDWIDASGGTAILSGQYIEFESIPIGFDFYFYNKPYSDITVSDTGIMGFDIWLDSYNNVAIPNISIPNNFIAPYWDYVTTGDVTYINDGEEPNRRLIVQWTDAVNSFSQNTDKVTFQAILHESSNDITYQYLDTSSNDDTYNNGASATVGIEFEDGTRGLQYSYNTARSIGDGFALHISNDECTPNETPLYFYVDSPWSTDIIFAGDLVELKLKALRCNNAVAGLEVNVDMGNGTNVTLADDGVLPDLIAGDGIFSANWYPVLSGLRTLTFHATAPGIEQSLVENIEIIPNYNFTPVAFEWDDISATGTEFNTYFENKLTPIGFDFNFYGRTQTGVRISRYGILHFDSTNYYLSSSYAIPNTTPPNNYIAPFWGYSNYDAGGNIFYQTKGIAPNRRFIVQWDEIVGTSASTSTVTFQATLYESSNNIVYQYLDTFFGAAGYDNGAGQTVGIEYIDGSKGTQYSFKTPTTIPNYSAIGFFPTSDDSDLDGLSDTFEALIGTDPALEDTDGDGLSDFAEVNWDGDSSSYTPGADLNPLLQDTDGDGLSDFDEVNWDGDSSSYIPGADLNPFIQDTDGDGANDGNEIIANTDPLDEFSIPNYGDLNNDGQVNTQDVIIMLKIINDFIVATPLQLVLADPAPLVNDVAAPNGTINTGDLLVIIRKALGQVDF